MLVAVGAQLCCAGRHDVVAGRDVCWLAPTLSVSNYSLWMRDKNSLILLKPRLEDLAMVLHALDIRLWFSGLDCLRRIHVLVAENSGRHLGVCIDWYVLIEGVVELYWLFEGSFEDCGKWAEVRFGFRILSSGIGAVEVEIREQAHVVNTLRRWHSDPNIILASAWEPLNRPDCTQSQNIMVRGILVYDSGAIYDSYGPQSGLFIIVIKVLSFLYHRSTSLVCITSQIGL